MENRYKTGECVYCGYSLVVLPLPALCFLFLPAFALISVLQNQNVADEPECVKPTPCEMDIIYSKTLMQIRKYFRDLQLEGA